MHRQIQIDEFHVTVLVPRGLGPTEYGAICRTVRRAEFQAALRKALGSVFARYASLNKVRFSLSR